MAETTGITWTDHTFNIAWGCTKVSPGCAHCYADRDATRYGYDIWGPGSRRRTFGEKHWNEPRKWDRQAALAQRRERVFCSSMCDVFEDHPDITRELAKLWNLIRETPWLDWQLLTKRAERIDQCLPSWWGCFGPDNVWLGVSIESMDYAHRADYLRQIPAIVRFISYEPALGPLDDIDLRGIQWVIYGGESGPKFREDDDAWCRGIMDRCRKKRVAFFRKQSAGFRPSTNVAIDGEIIHEFPMGRS
jgi:protein gp37